MRLKSTDWFLRFMVNLHRPMSHAESGFDASKMVITRMRSVLMGSGGYVVLWAVKIRRNHCCEKLSTTHNALKLWGARELARIYRKARQCDLATWPRSLSIACNGQKPPGHAEIRHLTPTSSYSRPCSFWQLAFSIDAIRLWGITGSVKKS